MSCPTPSAELAASAALASKPINREETNVIEFLKKLYQRLLAPTVDDVLADFHRAERRLGQITEIHEQKIADHNAAIKDLHDGIISSSIEISRARRSREAIQSITG